MKTAPIRVSDENSWGFLEKLKAWRRCSFPVILVGIYKHISISFIRENNLSSERYALNNISFVSH